LYRAYKSQGPYRATASQDLITSKHKRRNVTPALFPSGSFHYRAFSMFPRHSFPHSDLELFAAT